jgi:hypothetical protein
MNQLHTHKPLIAGITTYFTISTLNVNGLNSPIKHFNWQAGLKRKTCLSETHLTDRNKHWLSMEKDLPSYWT